jgi:hypothetical protein
LSSQFALSISHHPDIGQEFYNQQLAIGQETGWRGPQRKSPLESGLKKHTNSGQNFTA